MTRRRQDVVLQLADVRLDGGTQIRAALDADHIEALEAQMETGDDLPSVVVFYDGTSYWLADGFHRCEARRKLGRTSVTADMRAGTQRDAVLFACGANASHGMPRTNADKRRAVETLLRDPEWVKWSDREIAKRCAVDHKTVASVRDESSATGEIPSRPRKSADGRTINTANIGSSKPVKAPKSAPVVTPPDEPTALAFSPLPSPEAVIEVLGPSASPEVMKERVKAAEAQTASVMTPKRLESTPPAVTGPTEDERGDFVIEEMKRFGVKVFNRVMGVLHKMESA